MSYRRGDIVRIRDLPTGYEGRAGYTITNYIREFVGRDIAISEVYQEERYGVIYYIYSLEGLGGNKFSDDMLEPVSCPRPNQQSEPIICPICGGKFHAGTGYIIDVTEYCQCCYQEIRTSINGYHEKTSWSKKVGLQKSRLWHNLMGFELEIDCCDRNSEIKSLYAYNIIRKTDDLMFIERDGSLDNGFEIISEPMDIQWLREGGKDKIKAMFDYMNNPDIKIREHSTCGLHVHVDRECLSTISRTEDEVIDNIYLIVETFKEEIIKFARRRPNSYCQYLTSDSSTAGCLSLRKVKQAKERNRGDRYIAVNNTNRNTIEFRMFKTTTDYNTLMATLEFVNNIVNIAKYKDIDGLTWSNIVNFQSSKNEFLNKYVERLNIDSETKIVLLSDFEKNKNNYSLKKFLNGDYIICTSHHYLEFLSCKSFLLPLLLKEKVTYHNETYNSLIQCLESKISSNEDICIREVGENNRLVTYKESYGIENSVYLDELIELWIENPELMA